MGGLVVPSSVDGLLHVPGPVPIVPPAVPLFRILRPFLSRKNSPKTGMPGWRRSADRTRLRANSLLTGNFTGNLGVLGRFIPIRSLETTALQQLLAQFPALTNREFYLRNREFDSGNRDRCVAI